jgi:organic radical activating enzyme
MAKKFTDVKWDRYSHGMIQNNANNNTNMRDLLDSTGCGFCLAKFTQVTLHLGTGMTHSCHHPTPHKIPLDELAKSPSALFNTSHLKKARKQMLNNDRPSECDYCWRIEDDGGTSDRVYKSIEPWANEQHDQITKLSGDENIYPSYLEVSFSNVCNLKCTYCGPEFSSKWVEELKKDGPIKLLEGTAHETEQHNHADLDALNYKKRDHNPYIEAFWKWVPDVMPNLKHFRITGGEPLMSKDTFKIMEWLIANPKPDMEFSINSNFSVPDKLWAQFIELITRMRDTDCVKKITLYTSIEGWGPRAEYARTGLDFELLKARSEEIAAMDNIRLTIMSAFNILSITSFKQMLEWVHALKLLHSPNNSIAQLSEKTGFKIGNKDFATHKLKNKSHMTTVSLDIPYLRHPEQMDAHFATHQLVEDHLLPTIEYMGAHSVTEGWPLPGGFETHELDKLARIVNHRLYFNKKNAPEREGHADIRVARAKFYDYINTLDKRRNTDFLAVFPEMTEFYAACKQAKEEL